jgi:hypothetical protein
MDDERLALLHELERADEAIAAELVEVDELLRGGEDLRQQALELESFFTRLPEERSAAANAVRESDRTLTEAQAAVRRAALELESAEASNSEERLADARRFELRARDSLHMAERGAASARQQATRLEAHAAGAERDSATLENRAAELSAVLERRPRLADDAVADPGPGPTGVAEWGTRTRAALLVARSQLATERDGLVRQANELGAVLLGEPLPPLGAAAVARRVEHALDR